MKRVLSIMALAVLTACGGGCGGGGEYTLDVKGSVPSTTTPTTPAPPAAPVNPFACYIGLNGDSILNGFELADTPAMIIKRLRPKYTVINRAVNGQALVNRVPAFYNETRNTAIEVIAWGVNDSVIPGAPYEQTLRDVTAYLRAEGRKVVFTGLTRQNPDVPAIVAFDLLMAKVAHDMNVPFADYHNMPFSAADIVVSNGHPAQAYTTRNTLKLIEVLDATAPECR